MNQFLQALQDRRYFYLSLFFFVIGIGELGNWLELKGWVGACVVAGIGLTVGTAVYFWGRPIVRRR